MRSVSVGGLDETHDVVMTSATSVPGAVTDILKRPSSTRFLRVTYGCFSSCMWNWPRTQGQQLCARLCARRRMRLSSWAILSVVKEL